VTDLKALHAFYDTDGDGSVCYHEFVNALGDCKLSHRAAAMIDKAWSAMGLGDASVCTGQDISNAYKCKDTLPSFLENFSETQGGKLEGKVLRCDFEKYYRELASGMPNEEYFARQVESDWHGVVEDECSSVKREGVEYVLKLLRHRLLTISNNNQEEFTLRNIFRDFDADRNGVMTVNEVDGLLSKLNIKVSDRDLAALFKRLDTNSNGVIEFEEFRKIVLDDPYK